MTDYTSLYKLVETLYSNYNGKSMLPDWFSVNLKTLLSKNITIEDWNSLQLNVKNVVGESSALYSFCNSLTPVIKELINSTAHTIRFNGNVLYLLDANGEIITSATLQIQYDMEISADSTNAVQNKVIKEALDKKLDKVTDPNPYIRVYGISPAGSQKAIPTSESPNPGYVAMYGTEGQLSSLDPTETYHVANKKYVDKAIENIDLKSDVVDIVHTHADLESYDTSTLTADDIIKVLQDETHDNASSYYRWNTVFEYVGSEGPYYTQTQVDEKLDNKVNKIEKATNWQVYGVGSKSVDLPNGNSIDVSDQAFPDTLMNRNWRGTSQVANPTEDKDIANKVYVDGRFDYVVLSKTQFIRKTSLDEDDRQLLLDFYNKHYGKTKIPLFAIDKDGVIATIALRSITTFEFYVWSSDQSPIVFTIQPSLPKRTFNMSRVGYLHNILGQDVWSNSIFAEIGVNKNNKLIITDGNGNQTPGQSPSVLIPPYAVDSNNKWTLTNGTFQTENPTDAKDISNKSYVDNNITNVNNSITETLKNYTPLSTYNESLTNIANNTTDISNIKKVIPNQANENNKLADKDFVNSTINSSAAFFIGNFATYADLETWQNENPSKATNNDYAYINSDEKHNGEAWRYQYVKKDNEVVGIWKAQFKVNDTPLTAEQLAAINSGVTKETIDNLSAEMPTDINTTEDGALILEHDGTEITGQKKTTYVVPYTLDQYKRYLGRNNYAIIQQNRIFINDGSVGKYSTLYDKNGVTTYDNVNNEYTSYYLDRISYYKNESSPFYIDLKNNYIRYSNSYITVDLKFGNPYLYVNISTPVANTKINFPQPKEDKNSLTLATTDDIESKLDVIRYDDTKLIFDDNNRASLPADLKELIKPYFDNNKTFVLVLYNTNTITTYYLKGMRIIEDQDTTFISFDGDTDNSYTILEFYMTDNYIYKNFINIAEQDKVVQYQPGVAKAVYTNNENKQQSMVAYSLLPGDSNIAQFDTNGHLYTNDPSIDSHCANKKYVDSKSTIVLRIPVDTLSALENGVDSTNTYYNTIINTIVLQAKTNNFIYVEDTNNQNRVYVLEYIDSKPDNPTGTAEDYYEYHFVNIKTNSEQIYDLTIYFNMTDVITVSKSTRQFASDYTITLSKYTSKYTGDYYNPSVPVVTVVGRYTKNDGQIILDLSREDLMGKTTVNSMNKMFSGCKSLLNIPYINTKYITNMSYTFENCYSLSHIPYMVTQNVTTMEACFINCFSLVTIPLLQTLNVTTFKSCFEDCSSLSYIPKIDTSKATDMSRMFYKCHTLKELPLLDTSNVTDISFMFIQCNSLTEIPALNVSNVTKIGNILFGSKNIKSILMYGMKVNFNISSSTFSREALVTILNNLSTVETTQTLSMGSTNLAQLTDEDKAIATAKGWTLA